MKSIPINENDIKKLNNLDVPDNTIYAKISGRKGFHKLDDIIILFNDKNVTVKELLGFLAQENKRLVKLEKNFIDFVKETNRKLKKGGL